MTRWEKENPNPFGDRHETGVTSGWGGVVHAVLIGQTSPSGARVRAECGEYVQRGLPNPERKGNYPTVCDQCMSAVYVTNTLIERHDARTGQ